MAGVRLNHIVKKYSGAEESTVKDFHLELKIKSSLYWLEHPVAENPQLFV